VKVDILKALADPSRLSLLQALGRCELCACVLPAMVKKTQPTVSSHLKILRKAGLVAMRKDGVKRLYSISSLGKKVLGQVSRW
jgi:DNA-binding transcriptional ArsR family regulator